MRIFKQIAPIDMLTCISTESLKSHDIITLQFCEVIKDLANNYYLTINTKIFFRLTAQASILAYSCWLMLEFTVRKTTLYHNLNIHKGCK